MLGMREQSGITRTQLDGAVSGQQTKCLINFQNVSIQISNSYADCSMAEGAVEIIERLRANCGHWGCPNWGSSNSRSLQTHLSVNSSVQTKALQLKGFLTTGQVG